MKKITLVILLLLSFNDAFSQSMRLRKLEVIDSIYVPARINASEYFKDGVPFSSGGGDVYLGNRQTFTSANIFSDTLKADGLSLIDNARITSNLSVTGDITSDLEFIKGSRVRIGTSDNYGVVIKTADTNRLAIDSLGIVSVNKSLSAGTYILSADSLITSSLVGDAVYLNGLGKAIYWRGYGSSIQEGVNALYYNVNSHYFKTVHYNTIALLDSATGLDLKYGNYFLNGHLLFDSTRVGYLAKSQSWTGVNTFDSIVIDTYLSNIFGNTELGDLTVSNTADFTGATITGLEPSDVGVDTSKFAHTDLGTEIFSNIVKFITNIVDFAAGLTTTTITASSTATFNGNVVTGGYNDFGNTGNFEKMIIVKGKLGTSSVGSTNIAHGFTGNDYLRITNFDCVVRNDTNVSGQLKFVKPGSWYSNYAYYAKIDSLNCNVTLGGGGTNNLVSDSVFFRIWYHP